MINKSNNSQKNSTRIWTCRCYFNNAGVDNGAGRIHEYPVEVFDKIMAVDMRGTF